MLISSLAISALLHAAAPPTAGYMNEAALTQTIERLDHEYAFCHVNVIGSSREGRPLHMLTLSDDLGQARQRPAVLITAGLDGRHLVGTETAIRAAEFLLKDHGPLLGQMTFYIMPRANPDAAERNLSDNGSHIGTMREIDDDRDGTPDENPAADLNGDGFITQMRRLNPPLDDPPTHAADAVEPRLLIKADSAKGQTAIYTLYTEGLDTDNDGLIAEDGVGGVDLNCNFMHRWPEFADDAGPHQLSEPESAALAAFVLEHLNIAAAITYGRHDNLINLPDAEAKDITGQSPRELDKDDLELYRQVSKTFKDITGQQRAPREDTAGSFHAWLYAQRGIPSFATVVWGRPDYTRQDGDEARDKDGPKPQDEEAWRWLHYSDRDRNGEGFLPWTPFDHPTLGKVEIGGFVPGFQMNPPGAQLDELAAKQAAFAADLAGKLPRLSIQGPDITALSEGLYEIRLAIVNSGFLPAGTAMSRKARAVPPTIIRIDVPREQIVSGDPITRAWGIEGSSGRHSQRWIIRAKPNAQHSIEITSPSQAAQVIRFNAAQTTEARP